MVKCPICNEEITKKTEKGWHCDSCDEDIPDQYADGFNTMCGCGGKHLH